MKKKYSDWEGNFVDIDDLVHQVGDVWILAEWVERAHQWQAPIRFGERSGGEHTVYGPTLASVAGSSSIYKRETREGAIECAVDVHELDAWDVPPKGAVVTLCRLNSPGLATEIEWFEADGVAPLPELRDREGFFFRVETRQQIAAKAREHGGGES